MPLQRNTHDLYISFLILHEIYTIVSFLAFIFDKRSIPMLMLLLESRLKWIEMTSLLCRPGFNRGGDYCLKLTIGHLFFHHIPFEHDHHLTTVTHSVWYKLHSVIETASEYQ